MKHQTQNDRGTSREAIQCPDCGEPSLVFWTAGPAIRCDLCWERSGLERERLLKAAKWLRERIVFCPTQVEGDIWITARDVGFGELSEFIERCIEANRTNSSEPLLVVSHDGISSLIGLLESRIADPFCDPDYLKLVEKETQLDEKLRHPTDHDRFKVRQQLKSVRRSLALFLKRHVSYELFKAVQKLRSEHGRFGRYRVARQQTLVLDYSPREPAVPHERVREIPVEYVPWVLLEPSGFSVGETVLKYFRTLGTILNEDYDEERINFVCDFGPDEVVCGLDGWQGYAVFCFKDRGRVVLECPKFGNAIYLMPMHKWRALSKLSKTELLHEHRREVSRIIHSRNWQAELRLWVESGGTPLFD